MKKPMSSEVPRTAVPSDAAAIPANCDGNRAECDCGHFRDEHGETYRVDGSVWSVDACHVQYLADDMLPNVCECMHFTPRTTAAQLADGAADATEAPPAELLKALEARLSQSEAREREAREALRGMLSLYGAIVDAHGGGDLGIDHADGCPQDDTCDCPLYVLARDAESRARRVIEGER